MKRLRLVGAATAALLLVSTAACGGGGASGSATGNDTLTIISTAPPRSLDPGAASVGGDNFFVNLAYDTLLRVDDKGAIQPDLATKWGFVGEGNKVFEMTIRSGVKFADGTDLTADAVAKSLDYIRTKGRHGQWMSSVTAIEATDAATVRITMSAPNPVLPQLLSQIQMMGSVISAKGLADPKQLGTQTFGAGPYVLDTAQTASDDHYTFTANPNYWDQSKVQWKKVVIKVVANPESALNTVTTGQADLLQISANQADSAKKAGLTIVQNPLQIIGVLLADRDGKLAKPLADVRVRQALNYAIDRDAITKAVFGDYAKPTDQMSLPGLDGFAQDYDQHYTYDVAKAKQLMAEAGYANGFSLKAEVTTLLSMDKAPMAVFEQWKAIGVTVDVTTDTTSAGYSANSSSTNFSAYGYLYGGLPTYLLALDWMLPEQTHFNPFGTSDEKLTGLLDKAAAASDADRPALYQDAMRYFVDQAWAVPVARTDTLYGYNADKIASVTVAGNYMPDLAWSVGPKK